MIGSAEDNARLLIRGSKDASTFEPVGDASARVVDLLRAKMQRKEVA
jgi:hypothetical protein